MVRCLLDTALGPKTHVLSPAWHLCAGAMTGCTSTQNGYCCPCASGFPEATLLLL